MVQYDKYILNALVDSYENSVLFTGENKVNVTIRFDFNRKNIPAYFDESSLEYEKIHAVVEMLEVKGFVVAKWKQPGILSKVILRQEALEEVYSYLKRTPKKLQISDATMRLAQFCEQYHTPVCAAFLEYLQERIKNHLPVKEYMDFQDMQAFDRLMVAIHEIETNDMPCYVREFSIRVFQDSKVYEKIHGKVCKVFRQFSKGFAEADETEILSEYNIYHTPNYVHLKGDFTLFIEDKEIPVRELKQGVGISGEDIDDISLGDISSIRSVMTVENLTSFFRCEKANCLLIYLGGYHNGVRRSLLQKVVQSLPEVKYYHFGDIDAGGFEIYRDLVEKTKIPFEMYQMDLETLQKYEEYGKPLTPNNRKSLERTKERTTDKGLVALIDYMLERGVKLEQECVVEDILVKINRNIF